MKDVLKEEKDPMRITDRITIMTIIAFFVVSFSFLFFYFLLFKDVKTDNREVILFVLGAITNNLTSIIAYYFGSSKGSADKEKIIKDNIGRRKTDQVPPPEEKLND